jgi:hypothetical protein
VVSVSLASTVVVSVVLVQTLVSLCRFLRMLSRRYKSICSNPLLRRGEHSHLVLDTGCKESNIVAVYGVSPFSEHPHVTRSWPSLLLRPVTWFSTEIPAMALNAQKQWSSSGKCWFSYRYTYHNRCERPGASTTSTGQRLLVLLEAKHSPSLLALKKPGLCVPLLRVHLLALLDIARAQTEKS